MSVPNRNLFPDSSAVGRLAERIDWSLFPAGEATLVAAVSGGADSVFLSRVLARYAMGRPWTLILAHVHHGVRGAFADGDQEFVEQLSRELGVEFMSARLDSEQIEYPFVGDGGIENNGGENRDGGENSDKECNDSECGGNRRRLESLGAGTSLEGRLRLARWGVLTALARSRGADALVAAHHRDDLAETFLLQALRGAGLTGLGSMQARGEWGDVAVLRPLLQLGGAEIREALRADGFSWREDETNRDPSFKRNWLRMEILPRIEERCPGGASALARTAQLSADESEELQCQALQWLERSRPPSPPSSPSPPKKTVSQSPSTSLFALLSFPPRPSCSNSEKRNPVIHRPSIDRSFSLAPRFNEGFQVAKRPPQPFSTVSSHVRPTTPEESPTPSMRILDWNVLSQAPAVLRGRALRCVVAQITDLSLAPSLEAIRDIESATEQAQTGGGERFVVSIPGVLVWTDGRWILAGASTKHAHSERHELLSIVRPWLIQWRHLWGLTVLFSNPNAESIELVNLESQNSTKTGWLPGKNRRRDLGAGSVRIRRMAGTDLPASWREKWRRRLDREQRAILEVQALHGPLIVRPVLSKDRLEIAKGRHREAGDILSEKGVPQALRGCIPVVCDAAGPLWLISLRRSRRGWIVKGNVQSVLILDSHS